MSYHNPESVKGTLRSVLDSIEITAHRGTPPFKVEFVGYNSLIGYGPLGPIFRYDV